MDCNTILYSLFIIIFTTIPHPTFSGTPLPGLFDTEAFILHSIGVLMKARKNQHAAGLGAEECTLLPYRGIPAATISLKVKDWCLERCQITSLDCLWECEWGRWFNTSFYRRWAKPCFLRVAQLKYKGTGEVHFSYLSVHHDFLAPILNNVEWFEAQMQCPCGELWQHGPVT